MLNLLPLLQDRELVADLGSRVMVPALRRMLEEFESARMTMRDRMLKRKHNAILLEGRTDRNIYVHVLQALLQLLLTDFEERKAPAVPSSQAFIHGASSCGTCTTHSKPSNP